MCMYFIMYNSMPIIAPFSPFLSMPIIITFMLPHLNIFFFFNRNIWSCDCFWNTNHCGHFYIQRTILCRQKPFIPLSVIGSVSWKIFKENFVKFLEIDIKAQNPEIGMKLWIQALFVKHLNLNTNVENRLS